MRTAAFVLCFSLPLWCVGANPVKHLGFAVGNKLHHAEWQAQTHLNAAFQFLRQAGVIVESQRRQSNEEMCKSVGVMNAKQLGDSWKNSPENAGKPMLPSECLEPMMDLLKTMCSSQCKASPLVDGMMSGSGRRQLIAGAFHPPATQSSTAVRRLLGGDAFNQDPSKACMDPCYQPFVNSMLQMMKVMFDPKCAALITIDEGGQAGSDHGNGRRLLGGAVDSEVMRIMEISFGMLCSKNEAGLYCQELMTKIQNTPDKTGCDAMAPLKDLGCCWSNMVMLMTAMGTQMEDKSSMMGMETPSGNDDIMGSITIIEQTAKTCGVTLGTEPCASSLNIAAVAATTILSGVTQTQFDSKAQKAFRRGIATATKTSASAIAITAVSVSRRAGLNVELAIQLVGDETSASRVSAVEAAMKDKALVESSVKAAGIAGGTTAFAGCSVTSTSTAQAYSASSSLALLEPQPSPAATASSSGGLALGIIVLIVVGAAVILGGVAGGVYYFQVQSSPLEPSASGPAVATDSDKPVFGEAVAVDVVTDVERKCCAC